MYYDCELYGMINKGIVLANYLPDREILESDFFLDSWGESSAPSKIDWSSFLYQFGSGSGTFKSVVAGTPSAGASLWDGEFKGSLAASPSVDGGAGRSRGVSLVAFSLSLDDSGAGSLADSADVPFVREFKGSLAASPSVDGGAGRYRGVSLVAFSLSLEDRGADVLLVASSLLVCLVLESASLASGGFFLDPTIMMVPLPFSK